MRIAMTLALQHNCARVKDPSTRFFLLARLGEALAKLL
jgi:hypothetical protein